jgi:ribosomal protein S18 acetylase RimI-like enzyme
MVPDVTIRRGTEDDIPGIQRVARTAWREAYGDVLAEPVIEELLAEGYDTDVLTGIIRSTEVAVFVAEDEYSVVGYVSCEPPTDGHVGQASVYVSPDYWGEGIGTELLDRAADYLRAKGATALQDTLLADNEVGNAFYRKHCDLTEETTVQMGDEEFAANVYAADL